MKRSICCLRSTSLGYIEMWGKNKKNPNSQLLPAARPSKVIHSYTA